MPDTVDTWTLDDVLETPVSALHLIQEQAALIESQREEIEELEQTILNIAEALAPTADDLQSAVYVVRGVMQAHGRDNAGGDSD